MVDGFKVYVEAINIFSHNNKIPVKNLTEKEGGRGVGEGGKFHCTYLWALLFQCQESQSFLKLIDNERT